MCTQSTISVNHKSKANSDPCILEYVLLVQQLHTFWTEMSKLKQSPAEYRSLFSMPFIERNLKTR